MSTDAGYLDHFLTPFAALLADETVTDILVNRPHEIWVERAGGAITKIANTELDEPWLLALARQVASATSQGISRRSPLLSGSLPCGARIQIVLPPATRHYPAVAIRRHQASLLPIESFVRADGPDKPPSTTREAAGDDHVSVLRHAVHTRQNILISGGTGSGKTTFLNSLLGEIDAGERLIAIEDAPELKLTSDNAVGLIAVRGEEGEASVSADDLLIAALRMRPDRILLGEIRGREAMTYLRAINTGHPGSMSTIHANSARGAVDQLAFLVMQSGTSLRWEEVSQYITRSIDLFVHLERGPSGRCIASVNAGPDLMPTQKHREGAYAKLA
jgi:type IV secretion system protein VirB11